MANWDPEQTSINLFKKTIHTSFEKIGSQENWWFFSVLKKLRNLEYSKLPQCSVPQKFVGCTFNLHQQHLNLPVFFWDKTKVLHRISCRHSISPVMWKTMNFFEWLEEGVCVIAQKTFVTINKRHFNHLQWLLKRLLNYSQGWVIKIMQGTLYSFLHVVFKRDVSFVS